MAVFEVTDENGHVYEVTAPDDATEEQISAAVKQQSAPAKKPKKPRNPNLDNSFVENLGAGLKNGFRERGLGVFQAAYDVAKGLGVVDQYPELEAAIQDERKTMATREKGTGVGGAVGEFVGDPLGALTLPIGGGSTLALKAAGRTAARKAIAEGGTRKAAQIAARRAVTRGAAVSGAKVGGAYGAANAALGPQSTDSLADRGENIAKGAAGGAAAGAVLPVVAAGVGGTVRGARETASDLLASRRLGTTKDLIARKAALFDESSKMAAQMRAKSGPFTPQGANSVNAAVDKAFAADRLHPDLHPQTSLAVSDLKQQIADGTLDVTGIDQVLKLLGKAKGEDGAQAGRARSAILDAITQPGVTNGGQDAVDDLIRYRQQWQKASRFADVANPTIAAKGDANVAKSRLNTYLNSDKNKGFVKNFTPQEREAADAAADNGLRESILRVVGRLGIDPGTVGRNPRVPLIAQLMAYGGSGGVAAAPFTGGMSALAAAPVAVGTFANFLRNGIARGKTQKALEVIEGRSVAAPTRPIVPPVAPMAPRLTGPSAPLALPAPPTIMVPGGPGGALRPATDVERAGMYAQQGKQPILEVPAGGVPRATSDVQQQANDSVRTQFQNMGLSLDVLQANRKTQISAAEATKAMQDVAKQQANTAQVAASAPAPTVADMFQAARNSAADRAAAIGSDTPALSVIGQALADAISGPGGRVPPRVPAKRGPLKITVSPDPDIGPDGLPRVNLPKVNITPTTD